MAEAGIYGILLKWGLETIAAIVRDKDPNHLEILLEAIKTRNAIVLKRFDYAWSAVQEVNDLLFELDTELTAFVREFKEGIQKAKDRRASRLLARLQDDFHPAYYRKLRKLRCKFEATNDLFSAYSLEFQEMLRIDSVKSIIEPGPQKVPDVVRTYRHLWDTYSAVMATLVRVSSYDLRFWLADVSYFQLAEKQAQADRKRITRHFLQNEQESWMLSLEDHDQSNAFWELVEAQNAR